VLASCRIETRTSTTNCFLKAKEFYRQVAATGGSPKSEERPLAKSPTPAEERPLAGKPNLRTAREGEESEDEDCQFTGQTHPGLGEVADRLGLGFNAVGIDGNGHNIQIMRAFVASQDSNIFRWLFREAFPALVPSAQAIRVFLTDGCKAMISELEAACGVGQHFQHAKMFRCMFHLITKAFEEQFRIGDGWQTEVKKLLYQMRKM
jgi:hypothetical protein